MLDLIKKVVSDQDYNVLSSKDYTDISFIIILLQYSNKYKELINIIDENIPTELTHKTSRGWNLLHIASKCSYDALVMVLKHYEGIDDQNNDGWTALHIATKYSTFDAVKLLLEYGANPSIKNKGGLTPLYLAAKYCDTKVDKKVLDLLLHVSDIQDAVFWCYNVTSLKMILDYDYTQLYKKDNNGWSLMHYAVYYNNKDIIELLLKYNLESSKDNFDWPPIFYAETPGMINFLVEKGFDIHEKTKNGDTILHIATKYETDCDLENIKTIIDHKVIICANNNGQTPLLNAVKTKKDISIINYLLQKGSCFTETNNFGVSALELALKYIDKPYDKSTIDIVINNKVNKIKNMAKKIKKITRKNKEQEHKLRNIISIITELEQKENQFKVLNCKTSQVELHNGTIEDIIKKLCSSENKHYKENDTCCEIYEVENIIVPGIFYDGSKEIETKIYVIIK